MSAARATGVQPDAESSASDPAVETVPALFSTVQYLAFEPGLYSVEVSADPAPLTELGVVLPAIRLEFLPSTPTRYGRASLVAGGEGGWLCGGQTQAYVLVVGGRAGAMLTIYRANDGTPAPQIRLSTVPAGILPPGAAAQSAREEDVALAVIAHITGLGDVTETSDGWLGRPGAPIEGFAVTPAAPLAPEAIAYQAILGPNWTTPWMPGGSFCGSRGLNLPVQGYRLQLVTPGPDYECIYSGRFAGGRTSGPHRQGEACQADDALLEAMHIVIRRRVAEPTDPQAEAAAEADSAETADAIATESGDASAGKRRRPTRP